MLNNAINHQSVSNGSILFDQSDHSILYRFFLLNFELLVSHVIIKIRINPRLGVIKITNTARIRNSIHMVLHVFSFFFWGMAAYGAFFISRILTTVIVIHLLPPTLNPYTFLVVY
jgi:hypothetical protein